jgi:hypothetical protein
VRERGAAPKEIIERSAEEIVGHPSTGSARWRRCLQKLGRRGSSSNGMGLVVLVGLGVLVIIGNMRTCIVWPFNFHRGSAVTDVH